MRFEDERYIRVYTRDTTTTLMLSWEARSIMWEVFRKVDRAGLLELGDDGLDALAATIRIPIDVVERVMPELLRRKVFELRPDGLLICPRFVEAQEALASDKARAKASRERARDTARAKEFNVTLRDGTDTPRDGDVPPRDETVTHGHAASHAVTLNHTRQDKPDEPSEPPKPDGGSKNNTGARLDPTFALGAYHEGAQAGLRAAKNDPKARLPDFRGAWPELESLIAAHCPPELDEQGRLDWLRTIADRYVRATYAEAKYQSGFRPGKCANWLTGGGQPAHVEIIDPERPKWKLPPREPQPDPSEYCPPPPEFLEALKKTKGRMFGGDDDSPGADVRWTPKAKAVNENGR